MAADEIDSNGIPTIDVLGHEVPLPAYWRIVELWNKGMTAPAIINRILDATGPNTRLSVTTTVHAILENLCLMRAVPTGGGLKRSSVVANIATKKPKRVSAYRASRLAAANDHSESIAKLLAAQEAEEKLVTQALQLLAKRAAVSKSNDGDPNVTSSNDDDSDGRRQKRRVETAAIDLEMRRALKKHQAVEAEIDYARTLVQLSKASLA